MLSPYMFWKELAMYLMMLLEDGIAAPDFVRRMGREGRNSLVAFGGLVLI